MGALFDLISLAIALRCYLKPRGTAGLAFAASHKADQSKTARHKRERLRERRSS